MRDVVKMFVFFLLCHNTKKLHKFSPKRHTTTAHQEQQQRQQFLPFQQATFTEHSETDDFVVFTSFFSSLVSLSLSHRNIIKFINSRERQLLALSGDDG